MGVSVACSGVGVMVFSTAGVSTTDMCVGVAMFAASFGVGVFLSRSRSASAPQSTPPTVTITSMPSSNPTQMPVRQDTVLGAESAAAPEA
ncbi:MAG: hypothetical protein BWY63_02899 [Chloroflexi bacterium ADurb.Bin360]|nr:MAG: hypothetical protein BWY63_02899 [Chloroflexi bacterium ADurb.Bin360]